MNPAWHDIIQRHIAGTTTAEEAIGLEAALIADAELRALYLDYMNLDVALEAMAASLANDVCEIARPAPARLRSHHWGWITAAAACVAWMVLVLLPKSRTASPSRPDVAVTISAAQQAIAQLSVDSPSALPAWMSPTVSMLDEPHLPQ